jgi:hypothetical protein
MANMTRYLAKKLGDAVLKGTAYTLPSEIYLSLHSETARCRGLL